MYLCAYAKCLQMHRFILMTCTVKDQKWKLLSAYLGQCWLSYSLNSFKMNKSTSLSKHCYTSASQFTAETMLSLYKELLNTSEGLLQENNDSYKMVPPTQSAARAAKAEIIRQTNLWCHSMADIHDWDILCVWPLIKAQITFQGILQLK